jgi:hypothetical protein
MGCKCCCGSNQDGGDQSNKLIPDTTTKTPEALPRSSEVDNTGIPIRTVMYVEVGNLPPNEVRDIVASLMQTLHPGHPHFVVPLRNGKMHTDLNFEKEVLDFVQLICEIKDGQIALKDGCHDVDIIRVKV